MKKTLFSFALILTAMTAAAQTSEFYYIYDDDAKTATVTYKHGSNSDGGSYSGDVVIPAKAPNGYDVKYIGEHAFINSHGITSLTIPATIDSIGSEPFGGCAAHLTKITVEYGDTPLKCFVRDAWPMGCYPVFGRDVNVDEMFIYRILDSRVSRGWVEVAYDGDWSALRDSEHIKTVTLGNNFQEVPDGMFYGCIALEKVHFSPNTQRIGKEAFYYCEALQTITLPDGVELIDENAFQRCTALAHIGLPAQLKVIGGYAFLDCDVFTQFTIPASVDSIGNGILNDCNNLKRIDIPYSPRPLKYYCPNQFNNSLRAAPIDTLYMDRYIAGYFSDNRTLKKLYVGPNVTSIINEIFSNCINIDEVYSLNPVPPTCEGSSVFYSGTKENGVLHVPAGSLDAYKEAFVWKDFFNIQEIPDTKCHKPTATLENGELVFSCDTEDVEFHYEYSYPEGGKGTGNRVAIGQTVLLKLYASKAGLDDSDVAYYELQIASGGNTGKKGDVNEDGTVDVADISAVISIMASNARDLRIED